MKFHQLRAFLATLEHKTFSEAALELGMSQSAVSYAVAELEKSLGVTLLERRARRRVSYGDRRRGCSAGAAAFSD